MGRRRGDDRRGDRDLTKPEIRARTAVATREKATVALFTRNDARLAYLKALSDEAPDMLAELAAIVAMPVDTEDGIIRVPPFNYAQFMETPEHNMASAVADLLSGAAAPDYFSERDRALLTWFVRWRLVDRWAITWAERTAINWLQGRHTGEWAPEGFEMIAARNPFEFYEDFGWRPERETWEAWRARMLRSFRRKLSTYRAETLEQGEMLSMREIPRHHYLWTARYHNLGWSFADVARRHGKRGAHEKTVREAIRRVAELIGLNLRQPQRGRPVKTGALGR